MALLEKALREVSTVAAYARTLTRLRGLRPGGSYTVADLIEEQARKRPDAEALVFEDRSYSYRQVEEAANRVANWAAARGVGAGEVVSLLMANRPEYLFAWLGLAKIGATTALINTNLQHGQLVHALNVSGARRLLLGSELASAFIDVRDEVEPAPEVWAWGAEVAGTSRLDAELAAASTAAPDPAVRASIHSGDPLFYIYTSGTTGNPKAARFSHYRFLQAGTAYRSMARLGEKDRMYCVLPLYHTAGGVLAVGMIWGAGGTLVLRSKFSASNFFADCRKHRVTAFQYIGELCRYLLQTPERTDDRVPSIRAAMGNGLRPDVWSPFQERFGIPKIYEFYGATEGNVALLNIDNKVGSVGRVPPYLKRVLGIKLVRFDVDSESHLRGSDGFCIECAPGEPGEALGRIPNDKNATMGRFEGYTGKAETEKKVLHDVFEKGDSWFRTGDLLRADDEGYYYFVDRIGDTFRWKGENVATSEVAEALSPYGGILEVNVYGVEVPGADGRAGMAALVCDRQLDMDGLYRHVSEKLAVYARPLFVRLQPQMQTTGTFKHRKVELVRDGFDPLRVEDPLFFRDDEVGAFVPVDAPLYARIREGEVRI